MRITVSTVLFFLILALVGCTSNAEKSPRTYGKIMGVSYAASKVLIDSTDLSSVKNVSAKWIALMPYGFIREGATQITYNSDWQWIGEMPNGIIKEIQMCKSQGLKVMLKPHVWITHGEYTGDFILASEAEWKQFENSYRKYILEFAAIAESQQVELFCIGTEWRVFIKQRPEYWKLLINEIRNVYAGKITYAANWDEYTETPFWSQMDYIGVNAYFPLTEKKNPKLEEVLKGWEPISNQLENFSITNDKPILFTEYGYRSIERTTIKPWESDTEAILSMTEQEIALEALYKSNWNQPWLAGGFIWKWFNRHIKWEKVKNSGFTPQDKPAQLIVKKYYNLHK